VNVKFVNQGGECLEVGVLGPFLQAVLPALVSRAEEIRVSANLSDATDLSVEWQKEGQTFPVLANRDFHPFVTSSRLRILAGISLIPREETQAGTLRMKIDREEIVLELRISRQRGREIVLLRPRWEKT
jgi:hypothetical protein